MLAVRCCKKPSADSLSGDYRQRNPPDDTVAVEERDSVGGDGGNGDEELERCRDNDSSEEPSPSDTRDGTGQPTKDRQLLDDNVPSTHSGTKEVSTGWSGGVKAVVRDDSAPKSLRHLRT